MTYEFKEDEDGDFLVEQTSVLTGLRRVSVDNKVKYRGRLAAPYVAEPANMLVRFTLSKITLSLNSGSFFCTVMLIVVLVFLQIHLEQRALLFWIQIMKIMPWCVLVKPKSSFLKCSHFTVVLVPFCNVHRSVMPPFPEKYDDKKVLGISCFIKHFHFSFMIC